ncbi:MAG: sugar phosphate isomerase/epimerase family protein [Planctomycetota bacterium]
MECSCNASLVVGEPPEALLPVLKDAGFTHVSLGEFGRRGDTYVRREPFDRLRGALREAGLAVDWVHAPFVVPALDAEDLETRMVSLAALLLCLERAADLESRAMVIHPYFERTPGVGPSAEAGARVVDAVGDLAARGRALGVTVAIENMPYAGHHELVETMLHALPDLGFCLDAGHAHIVGNRERWRAFADRTVCTHFHDNGGATDDHRFPGEGTVDWAATGGMLRAGGYAGPWGLEVLLYPGDPHRARPCADLAAQAYACARRIADGAA